MNNQQDRVSVYKQDLGTMLRFYSRWGIVTLHHCHAYGDRFLYKHIVRRPHFSSTWFFLSALRFSNTLESIFIFISLHSFCMYSQADHMGFCISNTAVLKNVNKSACFVSHYYLIVNFILLVFIFHFLCKCNLIIKDPFKKFFADSVLSVKCRKSFLSFSQTFYMK